MDVLTCFKCFCQREEIYFKNMHKEKERLKTFDTFCNPFVQPKTLALLGFYYAQCSDICVCFCCEVFYINCIFKFEEIISLNIFLGSNKFLAGRRRCLGKPCEIFSEM